MRWIFAFVFVLILGHGHLIIELGRIPGLLGLPSWLFYYIMVHLIFVAVLQQYSKKIDEDSL